MQTDQWLNQPIHSRLQSLLTRIAKLESIQLGISENPLFEIENAIFDTQNDLIQVFIILLNAWLVINFQELLKSYFEPTIAGNEILKKYIYKTIEKEQNLNWENIMKSLKTFELSKVKQKLDVEVKELETKIDRPFTKDELIYKLKTIREFRNSFAHGSSHTMSYQSALDYYSVMERFIGLLHKAFQYERPSK